MSAHSINVNSVPLLRDSGGLEGSGWRWEEVRVVVMGGAPLDARLVFTLARLQPQALPLSVAGTDQGLIALYLSWERNIPQQQNRGAAATPPTE